MRWFQVTMAGGRFKFVRADDASEARRIIGGEYALNGPQTAGLKVRECAEPIR